MPTEEENVQYLYLVLTNGGPPTLDWGPICAELGVNQGAASKRWSRLKQALEAGKPAGAQAYQTLWTVFKHSRREGALDWKAIASKCGTTPGAASKRYSRMKQAFEKGENATPPATPKKKVSSAEAPMSTPKRKRGAASASKKAAAPSEGVFKPEPEAGDDDEEEVVEKPKKRAKGTGKAAEEKVFKPDPTPDDEEEEEVKSKKHAKAKAKAPAIKADPDALDATATMPPPSNAAFQGFNTMSSAPFQGFRVADAEDTFFESNEYPDGVGALEEVAQNRRGELG
ncbi:hypothetical protein BU23DRAFT_575567 [Bimuria novae-zelandiae CBS 107.79]|uniref:Myb-like DNA-binding domain-containing protein n=1 Tax=Bimuria novae-zelandiae CBS 107.79 TaxID=1447943 RepID=A0A6A5UHB6_9PLEO|nr:hypothetical protein BU23DRAFT_575567 [Bimuria novae-zelandiae CBS 107.79]